MIKWRPVLILLVLEIFVTLSWLAYHEYQPDILVQFGFEDYGFAFSILQAFILIVTPPLAGWISDRALAKNGSYLTVIYVGVAVVSMVFMAVASVIYIDPSGFIVYLIPVFIALWLISMNVFRSPALSMLESIVPQKKLTRVIVIFVLAYDIIYSLEPNIVDIINAIGATSTFIVGGIGVFIAGFLLVRNFRTLPGHDKQSEEFANDTKDGKSNFRLVITTGLMYGLLTAFILKYYPSQDFDIRLIGNQLSSGQFASFLLIIAAFVSIYFSRIINDTNITRYSHFGFALAFLGAFMLSIGDSSVVLFMGGIPLVIGFSIVTISVLPKVFYALSAKQTVLGIGLFYSCNELINGVLDIAAAA
jgi:hypothetical protein